MCAAYRLSIVTPFETTIERGPHPCARMCAIAGQVAVSPSSRTVQHGKHVNKLKTDYMELLLYRSFARCDATSMIAS